MDYRKKRIFVTGGTGFLGGHLITELAKRGAQITALGRRSPSNELQALGVRFIQGRLEDARLMMESIKGHDLVAHIGAFSSPYGLYRDFYRSNVLGTQNIFNACLENNVERCVYISSPSIYFDTHNRENITEDMPYAQKLLNSYVKTKMASELLADEFSARGLDIITLRPRAIFGPGDTTILPPIIEINAKGKFPRFNKGPVKADITYVDNVVDAILLAFQGRKQLAGEKFNITNNEVHELYAILEKLFQALGHPHKTKKLPFTPLYLTVSLLENIYLALGIKNPPPITTTGLMYLAYGQSFDITKAKRELGYQPKISVEEGLTRYASWYQEHFHKN
ncbi:MAG: NAD-dependent epimerase/dehydratase family protein [Halobacteriovoraceae bacterium]|nr:NAD-dependent epimerase/dehydratase family protein [Halobacteriovoraceae bacterium]